MRQILFAAPTIFFDINQMEHEQNISFLIEHIDIGVRLLRSVFFHLTSVLTRV
jgi:hypothetical protein